MMRRPSTYQPPAPAERTARAFSRAAPFYDEEQASNPVARWTRRQSLQALDTAFKPGDLVLELGCGTGEEAIHLASRGVDVVATDAAPAMLEVLEGKLALLDRRLPGRIETVLLPARGAGELVSRYGAGAFSGAYSSFGPLNCEPALRPVADALARLVEPDGRLVLSLINRYCIWETAWYLAHGQADKAFRRWSGASEATVRAEWREDKVAVFYWTPSRVEMAFRPDFTVSNRRGLPWLLPPQYLAGLVRRAPRLFGALARIDRRFAHIWPAYTFGDHFLLELVRRA